jgi:hypothetical protein
LCEWKKVKKSALSGLVGKISTFKNGTAGVEFNLSN